MKPKRHEQSRLSKQTMKKTTAARRAKTRKKVEVSAEDLARYMEARRVEPEKLLRSIKAELRSLEEILKNTSGCEDCIYRFYHQSFKVYFIQKYTEDIVAELQSLAPHLPLNNW